MIVQSWTTFLQLGQTSLCYTDQCYTDNKHFHPVGLSHRRSISGGTVALKARSSECTDFSTIV